MISLSSVSRGADDGLPTLTVSPTMQCSGAEVFGCQSFALAEQVDPVHTEVTISEILRITHHGCLNKQIIQSAEKMNQKLSKSHHQKTNAKRSEWILVKTQCSAGLAQVAVLLPSGQANHYVPTRELCSVWTRADPLPDITSDDCSAIS